MGISINLGIFFSLYFLVTGLALLINGNMLRQGAEDILANRGLMVLTGFFALIFGLLIISFHSYYGLGWPIVITIIGWLSFLKGVIYLIFEQTLHKLAGFYKNDKAFKIYAVAALFFSVFFACNVINS